MKFLQALCFVSILIFAAFETGHCRLILTEKEEEERPMIAVVRSGNDVGGVTDRPGGSQNGAGDVDSIGRFAVQEHNKKENSLLEFGKVIKVKEQVVAGKIYYITLEATDGGKVNTYEAKVLVKPWMKFKQLQEFKLAGDGSSPTTSGPN